MNPLVAFIVAKWSKQKSDTTVGAVLSQADAPPPIAPKQLTQSSLSSIIARLKMDDSGVSSLQLTPLTIQTLLGSLSGRSGKMQSATLESSDPSRVAEAEVATHLHVCAVAGITAKDCQ